MAKPKAKRGPKGPLTSTHLDALAEGRRHGRIVKRYLEILPFTKRSRGRPPGLRPETLERLRKELAANPDPVVRLKLRAKLRGKVWEAGQPTADYTAEVEAFVGIVKSYSERFGLSWEDWLAEGVPAEVLRRGGLSRGGMRKR